jgi:hypothetical protein
MWMLVAIACFATPSNECTRVAIVVADNPASCEAIASIVSTKMNSWKMRLEETRCVRVEES